jgi:methylase of polypeptide subunit release factors
MATLLRDAIPENPRTAGDAALLALLQALAVRDYRFVTPTPATQARVLARPDRRLARTLEDVLGWSLPFVPDLIDDELRELLEAAGAIYRSGPGLWRSELRVSSLRDRLYLHSAYPTDSKNAVFFGPDSYRFADAIADELTRAPLVPGAQILDIGTGAGVGAIVAACASCGASAVMTDINRHALHLARINAAAAGVEAQTWHGERLPAGRFDLILANPPYIIDDAGRAYRDGGGMHGGEVSLEMSRKALRQLPPGGRFLLYTGSAIVRGQDPLQRALETLADEHGFSLRYREVDPDVFGEELEQEAYRDVDRIAVINAVFARP